VNGLSCPRQTWIEQIAQRIAKDSIDPVVLRTFVDHAAGLIDWLMDIGFQPAPGTPVAGEAHEAYSTRRYLWGTRQASDP